MKTSPSAKFIDPNHKPSRKHSKHRKKRGPVFKAFQWAKKNPLKLIAIILAFVLIHLTILFFQFDTKAVLPK